MLHYVKQKQMKYKHVVFNAVLGEKQIPHYTRLGSYSKRLRARRARNRAKMQARHPVYRCSSHRGEET